MQDPSLLSELLQLRVHVRNLLLGVDDNIAVLKSLLTCWQGHAQILLELSPSLTPQRPSLPQQCSFL